MIEINQVIFSSQSMLDDFGRVFFYKEKVYRAISNEYISDCLELLQSNLFMELTKLGYVPATRISNFKLANYELILEHERLIEIPQHEWSFEIFRQVAIQVLETNDLCNKYGYELKDAHNLNILFRGTQPVFVDIGSIVKKPGIKWSAYEEFILVFYVPMLFWSQNDIYIVRKLVESNFYRMTTLPSQEIPNSRLISLINDNPFRYNLTFRSVLLLSTRRYSKILNILVRIINKVVTIILKRSSNPLKYRRQIIDINLVRRKILELSPCGLGSEWSNYHHINYSNGNIKIISPRLQRIIELIQVYEKESTSIIDLAGNEGLVTNLVLERTNINKIILADYDSNAIDSAYKQFKLIQTKRVHIILLNFIFTSNLQETANRYRSDIVLALAVTHHLILTQKYSLEVILERLLLFSNRYVFVEFMPKGLWSNKTKIEEPVPNWYNVEWFRSKFENYFELILEEVLEENRTLFIGKAKSKI